MRIDDDPAHVDVSVLAGERNVHRRLEVIGVQPQGSREAGAATRGQDPHGYRRAGQTLSHRAQGGVAAKHQDDIDLFVRSSSGVALPGSTRGGLQDERLIPIVLEAGAG